MPPQYHPSSRNDAQYTYRPRRGSGTFVEIPYAGFDNRDYMNPIAKQQLKYGLEQEQPPSGRDFQPRYPKVDDHVPDEAFRKRNEYRVGGQWCIMFTPGEQVKVKQEQDTTSKPRSMSNLREQQARDVPRRRNSNPSRILREDWHQTRRMADGSPWKGPFWRQTGLNPGKPRPQDFETIIYSPNRPPRRLVEAYHQKQQQQQQQQQRKYPEHDVGQYYSPFGPLPPLRKKNNTTKTTTTTTSTTWRLPAKNIYPLSPQKYDERSKHIHDVGNNYSPFGPLPPLGRKTKPSYGIAPSAPPFQY